MKTLTELRDGFVKRLNIVEKEMTNIIGKNSAYGRISFHSKDIIDDGWIEFYYSKELTREEIERVLFILKKHFGRLDRPEFRQHFKDTTKERWNNYSFFTYLYEKRKRYG